MRTFLAKRNVNSKKLKFLKDSGKQDSTNTEQSEPCS
jgi:hypothetical protein